MVSATFIRSASTRLTPRSVGLSPRVPAVGGPHPSTPSPSVFVSDPSFLCGYALAVEVVHFRSQEKPKEDDFYLELSKLHTYDDVVERVAQRIGLDDPSKIRLTPHNCYSQQPKPQPLKYRGADHLSDMLVHYNQTSDILYYEVLGIPLPEFQAIKTLKVAFHHAMKNEVTWEKEWAKASVC